MMSSLASLLVAKAKATPEKVVPYGNVLLANTFLRFFLVSCSSFFSSLSFLFLASRLLLLALRSSTGFLNLGVGATNKIDANNELGLASACALDLGRRVVLLKLLRDGTSRGWWSRRVSGGLAEAGSTWRRAALRHSRRYLAQGIHVGRVADGSACVDGRRASSHLRWRGAVLAWSHGAGAAHGALRRLGIAASRVAGRAGARALVVHWAGGRAWRRRRLGMRLRERLRRELRLKLMLLRYLAWRRGTGAGGGDALDAVNAGGGFAFAETKALEAGVQRTHMEREKKGNSGRGNKKRSGGEKKG